MSAAVDYTPVLLAQVTDLQMRLTNQEALIQSLRVEVERLAGKHISIPVGATLKASIPLQPSPTHREERRTNERREYKREDTRYARGPAEEGVPRRTRPKVAGTIAVPVEETKYERKTMSLADVLKAGEEVTLQVGVGKDSTGNLTYTYATGTFDGTDLTITKCDLASALVGMKSAKPGEILYKFIDELKESGHIKRAFSIAPWRLCFVERDGVRRSLEELRSVQG